MKGDKVSLLLGGDIILEHLQSPHCEFGLLKSDGILWVECFDNR